MFSAGETTCHWYSIGCKATLPDEKYLELDTQLIRTRRKLVAPPDENKIPEEYYEKIQEEAEALSEKLEDGGFAQYSPPSENPIYKRSLWKYIELFGRYASDKIIDDQEARTLYDIAFNADEVGIKYFFRRLVTEQPVYYRWGGYADPSCLDDRNVSRFGASDAGGAIFNFSPETQKLYTNEPGVVEYGYDPLTQIDESPFGIGWGNDKNQKLTWGDDVLRKNLARDSLGIVDSERPKDLLAILNGDPEAFVDAKGSYKKARVLQHLENLSRNIDNVELVRNEIEYISSLFIDHQALHVVFLAIFMRIINARTIDLGTKHLYVSFARESFKTYINKMREFKTRLNEEELSGKIAAEHNIATSVRQDVVAACAAIESSLYLASNEFCDEPLRTCKQHADLQLLVTQNLLAQVVPEDIVQLYQDAEGNDPLGALLHAWSEETFVNVSEYSLVDSKLLEHFRVNRNWCEIHCANHAQTAQLFDAAKKMTMAPKDRVWDFNTTLMSIAMLAGMIGDGYFAAPEHAAGARGMLQNLTQLPRWAAVTLVFFGFAQPTYAGATVFFESDTPDDLMSVDGANAPSQSTYQFGGVCKCFNVVE